MLTFSSDTHVNQKLSESYLELIRKFIKLNEDLRWDNNFELCLIVNMDETPLLFNIPNTQTIAKIVSKEVSIKSMEKKGFMWQQYYEL